MISPQINYLFLDYFFNASPKDDPGIINCGWCYIWCYVVYKLYGGNLCSIYLNDRLHHAVIEIHGRYYDSEHLSGEEEIINLNCLRHHSRDIRKGMKVSLSKDSVGKFFGKWNFKPDNNLFLYGITNFGLGISK